MKKQLLIIDPQNDFTSTDGSLYVRGAEKDMTNLVNFIDGNSYAINQIHVTMDSHSILNIAMPAFWINDNYEHPKPFTIITLDDVNNGKWMASKDSLKKYAKTYVEKLSKNGKYPLCIWPNHCITGTTGYNVNPVLSDSLQKWAMNRFTPINYFYKGTSIMTEHYSVIKADVAYNGDPTTFINVELLEYLKSANTIYVAGEALSHCVANSVRDLVDNGIKASKITLLIDATSNVTGFEELGNKFIEEMTAKGMKLAKTTEF